jgi:hypothetical protein
MDIERAHGRHSPDFFGEHPESDDHKYVCAKGLKRLQKFRILEFSGLEDVQSKGICCI